MKFAAAKKNINKWYKKLTSLPKLIVSAVLIGGILSAIILPVAFVSGLIINSKLDTPESTAKAVISGKTPTATVLLDKNSKPFAYIYSQRRFPLTYSQIPQNMERAIISIEDRRFYEHNGSDWIGTTRAAISAATSGAIEQGGSTLDQQYVKNFLLNVTSKNKNDEKDAISNTPKRKLREMQLALQLEYSLKDRFQKEFKVSNSKAKIMAKHEVLTRYLNLVPFGNGAYGIEAAALTYFNKRAPDLTAEQAAMLAGMVQSSSKLNPFTNAKADLARRNIVLTKMAKQYPDKAREYLDARKLPLSITKSPNIIPSGCIGAGKNGFFCDFVVDTFQKAGIEYSDLLNNGYRIKTTLDMNIQNSVDQAVKANTDPNADNVASVMNVIAPGKGSHKVLAMASSRKYGLNEEKHETIQPQTFEMEGDGAGSVFKIFTVAAAMERGLGTDSNVQVPAQYQAKGVGDGGYAGCPTGYYCVKNAGNYKSSMTLTQALATSPNTPFVKLIENTGVTPVVDMAVRLGLRSLNDPDTATENGKSMSVAQLFKKEHLGSFTLGPTLVNPLELTNVAATLASDGWWCPPNPIDEVWQTKRDKYGFALVKPGEKSFPQEKAELKSPEPCKQVVTKGLANTLSVALSEDSKSPGTSAVAAANAGWSYPISAKTGTTETHRSAAFLGYTDRLAGTVYTFSDSSTPEGICSYPVRTCYDGNLYGGSEPAATWYQALKPIADKMPTPKLPKPDKRYEDGLGSVKVPNLVGKNYKEATDTLKKLGFRVDTLWTPSYYASGVVSGQDPVDKALKGALIKLYVSNGTPPVVQKPAEKKDTKKKDTGRNGGGNPASPPANREPPTGGGTVIQIPGLPPIKLP